MYQHCVFSAIRNFRLQSSAEFADHERNHGSDHDSSNESVRPTHFIFRIFSGCDAGTRSGAPAVPLPGSIWLQFNEGLGLNKDL